MLCISAVLKAQTDTVAAKISKIPVIHVDVLAKFPGGDFTKYIAANINYQKKSDRNLRGQVIISLKIDTNGKVSNVNILKSVTPQIDQEVAHVIKSSPRWQPAMVKGKPIGVYMVFNIDMGVISALAPPAKSQNTIANTSEPIKKPVIEPVVTSKKAPPVSEKKAEPTPIVTTSEKKPVLKAVKKPIPPYDKKPVPVEKKPLPQVVKKTSPPPPITKKTIPVAKTPPAPIKKPTPVIIKKPNPIVIKKPAEQIAKKTAPPAPAVKKPNVVAGKKAIPAVAKTIIPPPAVMKVKPPVAKPVEKKVAADPAIKHRAPLVAKSKKPEDDLNHTLGPSSEAYFPDGGKPGFFKYLSENIHYPILSKINKIEGEVTLSFVVDKDGTVTDIKIISAPAEDLAQEARRVILAGPKWKPGIQNGIPVKETFTVPINFKIQDNKPSQP
ncbi:energy transducer TonB [Mucilaginibacter sp. PPCGB 2223]|uniref:energy transducer TonB n=1 Tax=Mucilaginibacter sp. PPCGB 2223 TaxID=1886027 RepID=UPI0011126158|nr:TonB family protein [Mucilaginibacter sp. PPCGB 2223]